MQIYTKKKCDLYSEKYGSTGNRIFLIHPFFIFSILVRWCLILYLFKIIVIAVIAKLIFLFEYIFHLASLYSACFYVGRDFRAKHRLKFDFKLWGQKAKKRIPTTFKKNFHSSPCLKTLKFTTETCFKTTFGLWILLKLSTFTQSSIFEFVR